MHELGVALSGLLQAQVPTPNDISALETLLQGGPYGIILVLLYVTRYLYFEKKDLHDKMERMQKEHAREKQELNDKVLAVSKEAVAAVVQNTEVQGQIVRALGQVRKERQG